MSWQLIVASSIALLGIVSFLVRRWERASVLAGQSRQLLAVTPQHGLRSVLPYGACYVYYAVLFALEYGIYVIWQWTLFDLLSLIDSGAFGTFLYGLSLVVLVIGLLMLALIAEPYLRSGVEYRDLTRRFVRLLVIWLAAGGLGLIISFAIFLVHG
jgi:hypothetical protein